MNEEQKLFVGMVDRLLGAIGYTDARLEALCRGRVGVYLGMTAERPAPAGAPASGRNDSPGTLAGMVSRMFRFNGPSVAVDAHSASSMTAVHMACNNLLHGECDAAIAGSVSLLYPDTYRDGCQISLLASHPDSRSFSEEKDGVLLADGVGAVLLKRLSTAVEDGDRILAVIRSTVAQSVSSGLSDLPEPDLVAASIKENFARATVDPRTISYVEAASAGFPIGDVIEMSATTRAFRAYTDQQQFCALGSVKANIGHATAASGISQLAKVVLQLQHGRLAPSIKAGPEHAQAQIKHSPFYVQQQAEAWQRPRLAIDGDREREYPRRAMINSMGHGGFYAGAILEEYRGPVLEN